MSRNAVRVSSVSASGSTSRNVRPAASTVRTPSVVRRRYGVVSGPRGRRSVYARSLIGCRPYSRPYRGVMSADEFHIEHDTMGEARVPAAARWAAQTQRAVENFPVSGLRGEPALIHALGASKAAADEANAELGVLDADVGEAIPAAASEVADGRWDGELPIDEYQTRSGTSTTR